ncbi:hypothetical protein EDC01DRAFT_729420 [Geopyxis carbonaria]|nr:hypothetical protein EDC01DRAFT_729420 [Geopyxis carbonaria]
MNDSATLLAALTPLANKNHISTASLHALFEPPVGYVHPNRGTLLLVVNLVLAALTLAVVAARFYTRVFVVPGVGRDDWMILAATVVVGGSTALNIFGVKMCGFGRHFYDLPDVATAIRLLKAMYVLPMIYTLGVLLIKLSLLLSYRRLFQHSPRLQRLIRLFIFLQITFTAGCLLGYAFMCAPPRAWWDFARRADACPSFQRTTVIYVTMRSAVVAWDVVVLALPIPTVWRLDIPRRQRAALAGVFALGAIACVIAIARSALLPKMLLGLDVSWTVLPIAILDQAEQCLGIITASAPALAALLTPSAAHRHRRSSSSKLNLTTGAGAGGRGMEFLAFAFDPDQHACGGGRSTARAYAGESDENLVHLARMGRGVGGEEGISKTTTVTVEVSKDLRSGGGLGVGGTSAR